MGWQAGAMDGRNALRKQKEAWAPGSKETPVGNVAGVDCLSSLGAVKTGQILLVQISQATGGLFDAIPVVEAC